MLRPDGGRMTNLKQSVSLVAACALAAALAQADAGALAQADAGALAQAEDAARGKTLVESNGCFDCHRIGDRGSRLGPDLSDIGSRRTAERLQAALIRPDEEVLPENRFVRFVTKDGATITGKLLNQDTISVQLINQKEELKSYLRNGIREYTIVDKGLMPSMQGKLTDQQVADIVAYLSSLKESRVDALETSGGARQKGDS
jgi:putative heme-binding domain-containing protein